MFRPIVRCAIALFALSIPVRSALAQDAVKKLDAAIIQRAEEKDAAMRAEALSRLKQASLRLTEVEGLLKDAEQEVELWKKNIEPLIQGEEGRYLTSDEKDVRICYSLLMLKRRPVPGIVAGLAEALQPIAMDIRAKSRVTEVVHPLPESYLQSLAEIRSEVARFYADYNEPRVAIQGLYARAKKAQTKGELTLEIAMSAYAAAHAEELAARIEKEQMEAKRANAEKIGKAEAGQLRAEGDYAAGKIQAETKMTDAATEEVGKEAERTLLLERAKSPEVLQALAPFVTKTRMQPSYFQEYFVNNHYLVHFRGTDRVRPIPLAFLAKSGALRQTEDGLRRLLSIANADKNDRPRWSPALTDEEWNEIARCQKLLIELGPYLVEAGHLLP